ncbi:RNA-directed DNA polymerase, eukaryota [Tanacetum coccineum]
MMGRPSNILDSNGWTWTFRKNKVSMVKPTGNPFLKDVEKVSSSFYVSNFLDSIDSKGLWNAFSPYGGIVDAYIPHKRSKGGKHFGFIRFVRVADDNDFVRSLSNIWIGSFHMYINVSRFQRSSTGGSRVKKNLLNVQNVSMGATAIKPNHNGPDHSVQPSRKPSFASVVHGSSKTKGDSSSSTKVHSISLSDHDLIRIDDTSKVLLVKLKEVETMNSIYRICKNEGFTNLKIHHIGGLWIWIQFNSVASCMTFQSNTCIESITSSIKTITPSFKVDERMIWVEISGLPLCAWGSNAFKKVACAFGKFMFFEVEQSNAMCTGIVCISTKSQHFLSEKIHVDIRGESYEVQVQELGTWSINIVDDSINSSSDDKNNVERPVLDLDVDSD